MYNFSQTTGKSRERFSKNGLAAVLGSLLMAVVLTIGPLTVYSQAECNSLGAPLVTTGSITTNDPDQIGRLFRTVTNATTCLRRGPASQSGTTAYDFDQYTFTNDTGGPICVFVDLDATGCGVASNQISMAAYSGSFIPTSILANLIAEPGGSTGQNFSNSMSFPVAAGASYTIVVHNINAGTTCPSYTLRRYITNNCRNAGFDVSGDGNADIATFRPSGAQATWNIWSIADNGTPIFQLGSAGDVPVPGDYYGDEKTDPAVFRPTNGLWYTSLSPTNNYDAKAWGVAGDIPVQGDYDRDGITDLAVFRPSNNSWYILHSATSTYQQFAFGATGDKPVVADFDGDGKADPGVFRPSNGLWTVLQSSGSLNSFYIQMLWGLSTDIPIPADYDADGKADVAVFRPSEGNWYIFRSSLTTGQLQVVKWGQSGDIPQPADYDNDRRDDFAIYRPSDNSWWLSRSTAGFFSGQFGQAGDIPVTTPYLVTP
jgi:hypothetical protein